MSTSKLASSPGLYDTTDLNSWWGSSNQRALDYANRSRSISDVFEPVRFGATQAPTDWEAFRADFGGGYANTEDYSNWRRNQQRQRDLAQFVEKMATADPALQQLTTQMGQDYGQFKGYADEWVKAPRPEMDTSNRFEVGLSRNEARLNALLEDPETVRQTAAYKFRLKQGEEALQRNLGAKGMLRSGNRLQALTQYGQDMASQEYDAQAKRLSDLVGMYSTNWLGDKNANTAKYSAESNAWNQRGAVLGDLFAKSGGNYLESQKIKADDRLGWANTWTKVAGAPFQNINNGSVNAFHWG